MLVRKSLSSLGLFCLKGTALCSSLSANFKQLQEYIQIAPISLKSTGDAEYPYEMKTPLGPLNIKVGDFPDESLYSVVLKIPNGEQVILESDTLLPNWSTPPVSSVSTIKLLSPL